MTYPSDSLWRAGGVVLFLVVAGSLVGFSGCWSRQPPIEPDKGATRVRNGIPPRVTFTDITERAGIRFRHVNGATSHKLLPETMGSGCAFIDYDGDGRQDLLLVNSRPWPGLEGGQPLPTMALYRNLGGGAFADVTHAVGLDVPLFGMGVAVGDFDNDGLPDLFITAVGGSRLFRNTRDKDGKHRFVDVTASAGDLSRFADWPSAAGDAFFAWNRNISFPVSTAFVDYDKDGLLDLFVTNYIQWSPQVDLSQKITLTGQDRAYLSPQPFEGTHCQLFRNMGGGVFKDVSKQAGIEVLGVLGGPIAKSLGVVVADVDEDGWPDIVVANDTVRNFLFHNQGDGTFKERGRESGVAYTEGTARGAMGIDWGEYRPGQGALWIGNFANEPDTLLRLDSAKALLFSDVALAEGISASSRLPLTFGLFYFDYDLDGRLDCLTNNGHLEPGIKLVQSEQDYKQSPSLYWNTGIKPAYEPVTADDSGADLFRPLVGRGCACADIDGNGTLDVVLIENGGPARLLRNDGGTRNHWIRLALEGDGKRCNKSAIGARVVVTAGDLVQKCEVRASKGYLSCCELPLTFGLGKAARVDRVEIHWPGRDVAPQVLTDLAVDQVHRIKQSQ